MKLSSFELPCQTQPNSVFTELLRWEGESRDHLVQLLKLGQLEQVEDDCVWSGFEYLQERWLHNLFGPPVPVPPEWKSVFLWNCMDFSVFQFVPTAPCPATRHCWEEFVSALSSLPPPPPDTYTHWWDPLKLSLLLASKSKLLAFPCMKNAPVP